MAGAQSESKAHGNLSKANVAASDFRRYAQPVARQCPELIPRLLWTIATAFQEVDNQWTTSKRKGARLSPNPLFYLVGRVGLEPTTN